MPQLGKLLFPLIIFIVILSFLCALSNLENGKSTEDKKQLEEAIHKALISCYSIEGAYPETIDYIVSNYGIQYNKDRYVVKYDFYASNLMPDITVLEYTNED